MLYQLCCYKDRDPASSGFLITPAIYWRELYLKKTLAMHGTISASLHAGICIVREAPSQMDLLVRAFPGSPCWLMARGGLWQLHPKPCSCGGDTGRAPPVLLPHDAMAARCLPPQHCPQEHPCTRLGLDPGGCSSCPQPPRHRGMFSSIIHHPCMLNTCTQSPAVLILPERDSGTKAEAP